MNLDTLVFLQCSFIEGCYNKLFRSNAENKISWITTHIIDDGRRVMSLRFILGVTADYFSCVVQ